MRSTRVVSVQVVDVTGHRHAQEVVTLPETGDLLVLNGRSHLELTAVQTDTTHTTDPSQHMHTHQPQHMHTHTSNPANLRNNLAGLNVKDLAALVSRGSQHLTTVRAPAQLGGERGTITRSANHHTQCYSRCKCRRCGPCLPHQASQPLLQFYHPAALPAVSDSGNTRSVTVAILNQ